MIRLPRVSTIRPGLAAAALLLLTAACSGGDGGSSPTSPASTPPANIAGSWTGTGMVESVDGYCSDFPFTFPSYRDDLEITQNGADVDVRWSSRVSQHPVVCQFVGTVSGTSFSLTLDLGRSSHGCGVQENYRCGRRSVRRVPDTEASTVLGTVSGDQMQIRSTNVFRYYDQHTGQLLGENTFHSTHDLVRE